MRKIRILIADDQKASAQSILQYALPVDTNSNIDSKKHLDAIYSLLEISHFYTVGKAIQCLDEHPDKVFDIAFVDINFEETDHEEENETLRQFPANRRGLELLRVLRRDFPQTKVKVHTRYGNTADVFLGLKNLGVEFNDQFDLVPVGDIIQVRQSLATEFPLLLQQAASSLYCLATERLPLRVAIDAEMKQYALENSLDQPLQSLYGFTLRTLLAGWAKVCDKDGDVVVDLPKNLNEAIYTLRSYTPLFNPAGHLRPINSRNGISEVGYKRLMDLRAKEVVYASILPKIENTTRNIIREFIDKGWGKASLEKIKKGYLSDYEQSFSPMDFSVYPKNLTDDLGKVKGEDESLAYDALQRVLICRRVLLGLLELKIQGAQFDYLTTWQVIDLAVLAAIRNDPEEAQRHFVFCESDAHYKSTNAFDNKERVLDHCFNMLLGFRKPPRQAVILPESILPEEKAWLQNLPKEFPEWFSR